MDYTAETTVPNDMYSEELRQQVNVHKKKVVFTISICIFMCINHCGFFSVLSYTIHLNDNDT